jgi:hypothetical protein
MTSSSPAALPTPGPTPFSLVLGGPLYRMWRRSWLAGDELQTIRRIIVGAVLLAWVPLLVLSIIEGHAWGTAVTLPFLHDIGMHARLLLSLPLLIAAELYVHREMRPVASHFVTSGLIPPSSAARFDAAVASALRLRNSVSAEEALLALAYVVGVGLVWPSRMALAVTSWYWVEGDGTLHATLAGWWMDWVSLPLFQFLLLRWYFRLLIWARFLWQLSRMELSYMPLHPDRCGGTGFLSLVTRAFAPVLLAQSTLLAGTMAERIFFAGAKLPEFKAEFIGLMLIMTFFVLGPMLVFLPHLARAKRRGLDEFALLGQRYVREFDRKWLRGGAPADEPLIGSGDIQSLADLSNAFGVVDKMRPVPFTLRTVVFLVAMALVPVSPLLLTMIPLADLVRRLLKVVI